MSGEERTSGTSEAVKELSERKGKERAQVKRERAEKKRSYQEERENSYDRKKRMKVLKEHDFKCAKCGADYDDQRLLEVDHIEQRQHGGSHDVENLRPLCIKCHTERHDQTLENGLDYPDNDGGRLRTIWRITQEYRIKIRDKAIVHTPNRLYPASRVYAVTHRINYPKNLPTLMEVYDALVKYGCLDGKSDKDLLERKFKLLLHVDFKTAKILNGRDEWEWYDRSASRLLWYRYGASGDYGYDASLYQTATDWKIYKQLKEADGRIVDEVEFEVGKSNIHERLLRLKRSFPEIRQKYSRTEWYYDVDKAPDQLLEGCEPEDRQLSDKKVSRATFTKDQLSVDIPDEMLSSKYGGTGGE